MEGLLALSSGKCGVETCLVSALHARLFLRWLCREAALSASAPLPRLRAAVAAAELRLQDRGAPLRCGRRATIRGAHDARTDMT